MLPLRGDWNQRRGSLSTSSGQMPATSLQAGQGGGGGSRGGVEAAEVEAQLVPAPADCLQVSWC